MALIISTEPKKQWKTHALNQYGRTLYIWEGKWTLADAMEKQSPASRRAHGEVVAIKHVEVKK